MSRVRGTAALLLFGICAVLTLWSAGGPSHPGPLDVSSQIRAILTSARAADFDIRQIDLKSLREFYANTAFKPVWAGRGATSPVMLAALAHAAEDGLDPAQYHSADDLLRGHASTPLQAAEFDILLTDGALKFARDLRKGRPDLRTIDRDIDLPLDPFDPSAALARALQADQLDAFLAGLEPPQPDYARLKGALRRYRTIAAEGGWPSLPAAGAELFADDQTLSSLLRRRLVYEDAAAQSDAEVPDAVKRFQQHHGLKSDGRVGPQTLAALNEPASQRALEISANM